MNNLTTIFSTIGILIIMAILVAWPTQLIWNNVLIEVIDGLNPIGFWQALFINILCGILFKNSNLKSKQ